MGVGIDTLGQQVQFVSEEEQMGLDIDGLEEEHQVQHVVKRLDAVGSTTSSTWRGDSGINKPISRNNDRPKQTSSWRKDRGYSQGGGLAGTLPTVTARPPGEGGQVGKLSAVLAFGVGRGCRHGIHSLNRHKTAFAG